jgi:hypothetical protein
MHHRQQYWYIYAFKVYSFTDHHKTEPDKREKGKNKKQKTKKKKKLRYQPPLPDPSPPPLPINKRKIEYSIYIPGPQKTHKILAKNQKTKKTPTYPNAS